MLRAARNTLLGETWVERGEAPPERGDALSGKTPARSYKEIMKQAERHLADGVHPRLLCEGIDLAKEDQVVGLVRCDDEADLLTMTRQGYGKRTAFRDYLVHSEDGDRPQNRGGKGRIDIKTNDRNGPVVTIRPVADGEGVVFVTLNGQLIRTDVDQISRMGRNTQGVRVVRLRDSDALISMARVPTDD